MNKKFFNWLPIAALALGAVACQTDNNTPGKVTDPRGEEYIVTSPAQISDSHALELTASHHQFACDFVGQAAASGQNTVVPPLSMYNILAMMANGADGHTLAQILKVMGAKNAEEVVALCRRQLDHFTAIEAKNQEAQIPDVSDMLPFYSEEEIEQTIKDMQSYLTKTPWLTLSGLIQTWGHPINHMSTNVSNGSTPTQRVLTSGILRHQ